MKSKVKWVFTLVEKDLSPCVLSVRAEQFIEGNASEKHFLETVTLSQNIICLPF